MLLLWIPTIDTSSSPDSLVSLASDLGKRSAAEAVRFSGFFPGCLLLLSPSVVGVGDLVAVNGDACVVLVLPSLFWSHND